MLLYSMFMSFYGSCFVIFYYGALFPDWNGNVLTKFSPPAALNWQLQLKPLTKIFVTDGTESCQNDNFQSVTKISKIWRCFRIIARMWSDIQMFVCFMCFNTGNPVDSLFATFPVLYRYYIFYICRCTFCIYSCNVINIQLLISQK